MKSVAVITTTTGAKELEDCITSVREQDYNGEIVHFIVVDGPEYESAVDDVLNSTGTDGIKKIVLPFNTGQGTKWYGVKAMMASVYMVVQDYTMFLDQDNMLDPDHVRIMVELLQEKGWDWAYSLRKIYDKDGNYLFDDDCESLGEYSQFNGEELNLIDTSAYFFTRDFAQETAIYWNYGWGADRAYYVRVTKLSGHTNFGGSGKATLRYRLGGNETSGSREFFEYGNKVMRERYPDGNFPWKTK